MKRQGVNFSKDFGVFGSFSLRSTHVSGSGPDTSSFFGVSGVDVLALFSPVDRAGVNPLVDVDLLQRGPCYLRFPVVSFDDAGFQFSSSLDLTLLSHGVESTGFIESSSTSSLHALPSGSIGVRSYDNLVCSVSCGRIVSNGFNCVFGSCFRKVISSNLIIGVKSTSVSFPTSEILRGSSTA